MVEQFNPQREALAIETMVGVSDANNFQIHASSSVVAQRILDEVHGELCKINLDQRTATVNILHNDGGTMVIDGSGTAMGIVLNKTAYLPLDCRDVEQKNSN